MARFLLKSRIAFLSSNEQRVKTLYPQSSRKITSAVQQLKQINLHQSSLVIKNTQDIYELAMQMTCWSVVWDVNNAWLRHKPFAVVSTSDVQSLLVIAPSLSSTTCQAAPLRRGTHCKTIRISTDILWRVLHILTQPVPYIRRKVPTVNFSLAVKMFF